MNSQKKRIEIEAKKKKQTKNVNWIYRHSSKILCCSCCCVFVASSLTTYIKLAIHYSRILSFLFLCLSIHSFDLFILLLSHIYTLKLFSINQKENKEFSTWSFSVHGYTGANIQQFITFLFSSSLNVKNYLFFLSIFFLFFHFL